MGSRGLYYQNAVSTQSSFTTVSWATGIRLGSFAASSRLKYSLGSCKTPSRSYGVAQRLRKEYEKVNHPRNSERSDELVMERKTANKKGAMLTCLPNQILPLGIMKGNTQHEGRCLALWQVQSYIYLYSYPANLQVTTVMFSGCVGSSGVYKTT